MDLTELARGLAQRVPWRAARVLLQKADVEVHRGFPNTASIDKVRGWTPQQVSKVTAGMMEHAVCGEKVVQAIKVTAAERQAVAHWVASKRKTSSPLTSAFPGLSSEVVIAQNQNLEPNSLGGPSLECGSAAVYTAARTFLDKVTLPANALKPGLADGYEAIFGMKLIHLQTYDAIWVPPYGNYVCLLADHPKQAPKAFGAASMEYLRSQLRLQLQRPLTNFNLWPAIDGLYTSTEGRLVDYAFAVEGSQVNQHKARRRTQSLRDATYDKAGAAAVGDAMSLYRIALEWRMDHGVAGNPVRPELQIAGVAADLNKPMPFVQDVTLRNSLTSRDLDFVMSKLAQFMK